MKWNLQNRIIIPSICLIAVVVIVVGTGAILSCRSILLDALEMQMASSSSAALAEMELWIGEQINQTSYWAGDPRVAQALAEREKYSGSDALRADLTRAKNTTKLEAVIVAGLDGSIVLSSMRETEGKINIGDRDYFKAALSGGSVTLGDVALSKGTGRPIVVAAAPIKGADGKAVGVLAWVMDLGAVSQKIIKPLKIMDSGYVFMYDKKGYVLAHPDESLIQKSKMQDFAWGVPILQEKNGTTFYEYNGVEKQVVFRTSEKLGWGVVAAAPLSELFAPLYRLIWLIVVFGAIALVVGALISFVTARSIAKPLYEVVELMNEHSDQTASASAEVAGASNSLAAGASEQASAIEETSSSMEEISSMAKANAEGSKEANELARVARRSAEEGARDMGEMGEAMNGIKASSDDIRKIVKTIDEIAFQTNILALNAAVEAARAGEAGAGFAVVADEVRTLAQRSAKAAKGTAVMIEEALAKTDRGVAINDKVAQVLGDIVTKIRKVDELVAQAAQASTEQSNGIAQINTAIASMDKITQSNAASAEECASASEELSAQAEHMKEAVARLLRIAEGVDRDAALRVAVSPQPSVRRNPAEFSPAKPATAKKSAPAQKFLTSQK